MVGLSLMSCLSINGVSFTNQGLNALANLLSVIQRVQAVLLLPEYENQFASNLPAPESLCNF